MALVWLLWAHRAFNHRSYLPPNTQLAVMHPVTVAISEIARLSKLLPHSIPDGAIGDHIHEVLTTVTHDEGDWPTFNRRFDILFGEDKNCRDANGRFKHIRRGRYGMDAVCKYLHTLDVTQMPAEIFMLKLVRVQVELETLTSSAENSQRGSGAGAGELQFKWMFY